MDRILSVFCVLRVMIVVAFVFCLYRFVEDIVVVCDGRVVDDC